MGAAGGGGFPVCASGNFRFLGSSFQVTSHARAGGRAIIIEGKFAALRRYLRPSDLGTARTSSSTFLLEGDGILAQRPSLPGVSGSCLL